MVVNPFQQFQSQVTAVCACPSDNKPRLGFADLLDSTGDDRNHARAELIRVQIRLSQPDLDDDDWFKLSEREKALESLYGEDWLVDELPQFHGVRFNPSFRRGFPSELWCDDDATFFANATEILNAQPIESLAFNCLNSSTEFCELQVMTRISRLILEGLRLGPEDAENIGTSEFLINLSDLHLSQNALGDEGATAIAKSRTLTGLTNLDLGHNSIGDNGVIALANSPVVAKLDHLGLAGSRFTDDGAMALAKSQYLNRLNGLTLWQCSNIGNIGRDAIECRFGDAASLMD